MSVHTNLHRLPMPRWPPCTSLCLRMARRSGRDPDAAIREAGTMIDIMIAGGTLVALAFIAVALERSERPR